MTARKPSFPDRILAALAEHPGSTTRELAPHLGPMRSNELNVALTTLVSRGRVRFEGPKGFRQYFACEAPKPAEAKPSKPKRQPRATKEPVAIETTSEAPRAKPIDLDRMLDGFSFGKPAFVPRPADKSPADLLADAIEQHLEIEDRWHCSMDLAEALNEDRKDVALALASLVRVGRAVWREGGSVMVREYAHPMSTSAAEFYPSVQREPAQTAATAQTLDFGPLTDTHGAIADTAVLADAAPAADKPARPTRYFMCSDICVELLDLVNGIALDLEDLVGHACDERASHDAIKALAGAAGMARRAHIDLLRASPARTTPGATP